MGCACANGPGSFVSHAGTGESVAATAYARSALDSARPDEDIADASRARFAVGRNAAHQFAAEQRDSDADQSDCDSDEACADKAGDDLYGPFTAAEED